MKNLSVGECAYKLTVVISPEVHCAGVVVGRASTSGRCNSQHIQVILPEFGEEEHIVSGGMLDGFVDRWNPLTGYFWGNASLLQG